MNKSVPAIANPSTAHSAYEEVANSPPLADDIRCANAQDDRERTVRGELLRHFMRESQYRRFVITGVKLVIVAFCWRYVAPVPLLSWFAAGLLVTALRIRIERQFASPDAFDSLEGQSAFVTAMKPIYAVHAAVWGSTVLLFFDRIPIFNQIGCGMLMACVAAIPLRSAALIPPLLRIYMNTLFVVGMSCLIGASTAFSANSRYPAAPPDLLSRLMLAGIPVFYWWLLSSFGARVHANQREQCELQYDLKKKEHEARSLAEARIRFLTAAAHDLRQPTMAMSIYAEQLMEFPENHLLLAPRIARASNAVNHLFNSLFDLANLDSGKVSLQIEPVRIHHVLDDLRDQFVGIAEAKSVRLVVLSEDLMLQTDPVRLRRMIANVISNAIKYSPSGTEIRVAAGETDAGIRIEICDQGYGIPPADLDKVFEEFYRVDRHDVPAEDGVGLGLSIVSRLANLLGFGLGLHSVVGQGTRFTFVFASAATGKGGPRTSFDVG